MVTLRRPERSRLAALRRRGRNGAWFAAARDAAPPARLASRGPFLKAQRSVRNVAQVFRPEAFAFEPYWRCADLSGRGLLLPVAHGRSGAWFAAARDAAPRAPLASRGPFLKAQRSVRNVAQVFRPEAFAFEPYCRCVGLSGRGLLRPVPWSQRSVVCSGARCRASSTPCQLRAVPQSAAFGS
jgi:hypothetical protein